MAGLRQGSPQLTMHLITINAVESKSPNLDESTLTLMLSRIYFRFVFFLPESMTQTHLVYRNPMLIIQI